MCGSCLNKCISVALGPPKQKFLAPPLSVCTHAYVVAVWGLLGEEKENEFKKKKKSVRANGDLIDSVLGNFGWRTKLFLVLSMGCEMRQL